MGDMNKIMDFLSSLHSEALSDLAAIANGVILLTFLLVYFAFIESG